MTDEELRRALLRIAARESVSPRPAEARQRGTTLTKRASRRAWWRGHRMLAALGVVVLAVIVGTPLALVLRDNDDPSRLDVTNDPGTTLPTPSSIDVTSLPATTTENPTTNVTTTTRPGPTTTSTTTVAPAGRAPAGIAADATCGPGVVVYSCPIRRGDPSDLSSRGIELRGLKPSTRYALAQCLTTTTRQPSDCSAVSSAGTVSAVTDAYGNAGAPQGMIVGLRRYILVGRDVVDCIDVQCEMRVAAVDAAGKVLDMVTQPLVFADEPFPETQTADLLQLRHGVASSVLFPVALKPNDRPSAFVQVCARNAAVPFPDYWCKSFDTTITEVTAIETHAQFSPSRWALAELGADCAVPGVCWIQMSATGDLSYAYDRPIVVRGDTPAPSIEVSPASPWTDSPRVTVTLRNLEPRRFGVLAYCLDTARMQQVEDHGSGDGLNPACMPLAELTPTALGAWPPPTETFEVQPPRTLVDRNGGSHDCGAPQGCRIVAFWGTDTYFASGVGTIAWFGP